MGNTRPTSWQIVPLDLAILAELPDEGTKLGKFHDLGLRVVDIARRLNDEYTTSAMLNGRVRMLNQMGYVVSVAVVPSHGLGWQRTEKGKALLRENGINPDRTEES